MDDGLIGGKVLAPGDDTHAEGAAEAGKFCAKPSEPDDAEGASAQIAPDGRLPASLSHGLRFERKVTHQREDQPKRQFGGRVARRVGATNNDFAVDRCLHIDRGVAMARCHEQFQGRQALDHGARKRRAFAHDGDHVVALQRGRGRIETGERGGENRHLVIGEKARPIGHR